MDPDRFTLDTELSELLFTVALGLALGIALCGAWLARGRRSPRSLAVPVALVAAGFALFLFAGLSADDRSPFTWVDFRLKAYSTTVVLVVTMVGALAAGTAGALLAATGIWRIGGESETSDVMRTVGLAVLGLAAVVWLLDRVDEVEAPRHPAGTITTATIGAVEVARDLSMPTGLATGPGGEVFFTELESGRLGVLRPSDPEGRLDLATLAILPRSERSQVFHIALHPDWPRQPYLYVTVGHEAGDGMAMGVLRVTTDGFTATDIRPIIDGLPLGLAAEGNHFGTAIAFCGGYFFLSTGDTDTSFLGPRRSISTLAQNIARGEGKILRYRVEGADLVPAGVGGQELPIYAMGFRNPFGMACDPTTGYPVVAENGNRGYDQVRIVPPGSNHEWPLSDARDAIEPPVFSSGNARLAPTGVAVREASGGKEVVLGAFASQAVYQLYVGPGWQMAGKPRLLRDLPSGALALVADQRGCVYFSDATSIWRLDEPQCARR